MEGLDRPPFEPVSALLISKQECLLRYQYLVQINAIDDLGENRLEDVEEYNRQECACWQGYYP